VIHINLLPVEYRKAESTPIARFIAIVAGAVLVTSALVAYGYVHYSQLRGVREVRDATEAEFKNKKAQADISKNLQTEINAYEARRKAIQQVAGGRILHSRKLDELLDILHNGGDREKYFVWLKSLSVKPPRARRRGKATSGGTMSFAGFSDTVEFSKITNLREAIQKDPFYDDMQGISSPVFKAKFWDDDKLPRSAGEFAFDVTFKPLGWERSAKKKK